MTMSNFYTIFMTTTTQTRHKQMPIQQRIIIPIKQTTPRLTRLQQTIRNSLSRARQTRATQAALILTFINRHEPNHSAPIANDLLILHP